MIDSAMLAALADEDFCYLTTTGRLTGRPHTIEIWFALDGRTLYMLSGGRDRSDWVRNIQHNAAVSVRLGAHATAATGRIVTEEAEDGTARRLVVGKYSRRTSDDLGDWGRTALPVALDL